MNDDMMMDAHARGERSDISALASRVISALSDKSDEGAQAVRSSIVHRMVEATLARGGFNGECLLDELRENRLGPDQIIDIYIPETARALGEMWVSDVIGFAEVTIASARLQGLLTLLAPHWTQLPNDTMPEINTLLILQSSDCHTLGPHVATAQLRRLGATVRILFGADADSVTQILAQEPHHLVLFSCSRPDMLASIANTVQCIRSSLDAVPPIALGGLVLNLTDRVRDRTGVDLATNDVKLAFRLCETKSVKARSVACR